MSPSQGHPLLRNKSAQVAYRLSGRRRSENGNCFCGQSGTALLFAVMAGYTASLCLSLSTSPSPGHDTGGRGSLHGNVGGGLGKSGESKSYMWVVLIMACSTAFGFLGPVHDNPFHQSGVEFLWLTVASFIIYIILFIAYEVESLLGIFCSALIVSVVLQPIYTIQRQCFQGYSSAAMSSPIDAQEVLSGQEIRV